MVTALLLGLGFGFHNLTLKNASPAAFIAENKAGHSALDLRDGDIIFQSSTQGQSLAVQLATRSKWSHVGMLFEVNGQWMVIEAVGPVKFTSLRTWISHGEGQHYVIKRLVNADEVLDERTTHALLRAAEEFKGTSYDFYFEWSDDRMYCSELVWKAYKKALQLEIGSLAKLGEMDLSHPVVKQKLTERYGNDIPLDEWVITPGDVFDSPLLRTVVSQ